MWGHDLQYKYYNLCDDRIEGVLSTMGEACRKTHLATSDYLTNHSTAVEIKVLLDMQASLHSVMVDSTYCKTLPYSDDRLLCVTGGTISSKMCDKSETVTRLLRLTREKGILEKYPLLVLMKGRMTRFDVLSALKLVGVQPGRNVMETAWGKESTFFCYPSLPTTTPPTYH